MDTTTLTLNRLPNIYKVDNSVIRVIVDAIMSEVNTSQDNVNTLNDMIGIDTTDGDNLEYRWGSLLSLERVDGEDDGSYRSRMKMAIPTLVGGTIYSIKYSISASLGITDQLEIDRRVKVYDAWEYSGDTIFPKQIGHVICDIDLDMQSFGSNTEQLINDAISGVRASGISVHIIYRNYRINLYNELSSMTYSSLATLTYGKIGEG